jgi:hypothetical protein
MKKLVFIIAVCMFVAACEKNDNLPADQTPVSKRMLSGPEAILKANLDQTAKIVADIIQDDAVLSELTQLSDENREFFSLSFRDLLDESKSVSSSFSNLRNRFLAECSSGAKGNDLGNLADYLTKNDCYLYCPYPSSFYPRGTNSYTVAAHPIDNDIENKGYRYEGKKKIEVMVNEKYADKYMVLLIMPKDGDKEDGLATVVPEPSKGDPVYEVRIGKVRCADYCGGLFEGTLELRISRGYPTFDSSTEGTKGTFAGVIPIDYPRDYAKAAINGWTVHSEGGWLTQNIIWDSNWKPAKAQQCILVYEFDKQKEVSVSATVGYKPDNTTGTITATAKTTYSGDFLGLSEWDRDWFYATNTNPSSYDEVKDGLTVRKTCAAFKLTTPARTIY